MYYWIPITIVFIVSLSVTAIILIIGLTVYFKKRLEHKQIMAAIEKGTPLSELRPPKSKLTGPVWIKYLTFGIALIIITVGLSLVGPARGPVGPIGLITWIFLGVGVAWLIRGLLYRKYSAYGGQIQYPNKDDKVENKEQENS